MKSYSQASQDLFVDFMLPEVNHGTFLEIGAYDPIELSNSLGLEEKGWDGICIDIEMTLAYEFHQKRNAVFIGADASRIDYKAMLIENFYDTLDYVSLDVDEFTIKVLRIFPLAHYLPAIVTYEHDAYAKGDSDKIESRKIFDIHGYRRLFSDVKHNGNPFEDWYVHPSKVKFSKQDLDILEDSNLEHTQVIDKLTKFALL